MKLKQFSVLVEPYLPLMMGRMCEQWYPDDRTMPVFEGWMFL